MSKLGCVLVTSKLTYAKLLTGEIAFEPIFLSRLVSLVGKVPVYRTEGSGSIPGRTNTQGLKIIEEKALL